MKSKGPVAITGYGAYVPRFRLRTSEIAMMWKGGGAGPNKEKSVAAIDEDAATMAVEVGRRAVYMAGGITLGAVFVGTESKPYAVKPTSTIVAQALGVHAVLAADFEFACKAGTEAVQVITGLIGSGMISDGLAIGVDTAQGRPGDDLEYTAGSGAASLVLSNQQEEIPSIAQIEASVSYVSDTPDFWRRPQEPFPSHLSRFTGEPAYFHHVERAVKMLFDEIGLKPQDFQHAVFHQPNPKFPLEVANRLGFDKKQVETGLLNPIIGNPYSASALLGLVAILDKAKPGDRILLASFGSGAGSDAFSLKIDQGLIEKRSKVKGLATMLKEIRTVTYSEYAKMRGVIQR
jgi:hydroxymethylglutaryl-CoA synthase